MTVHQPLFEDLFWHSDDGLKLHARHYQAGEAAGQRPTLLCVHGQTRNAREFEPLAAHIAGRFRMVCANLRGRGDSDWAKDPLSYVPPNYVRDVEQLIAQHVPGKVILIGNALGGYVTLLMSERLGDQLAGTVLNDFGPDPNPTGMARVRAYTGKSMTYPSWMHCAEALQESNRHFYPKYTIEDWLSLAKRVACQEPSGRIVFDYDPKIAEALKLPSKAPPVDLWTAFRALARKPVLVVHGENSDVLMPQTVAKMALVPNCTAVTVPDVGHVPLLTETVALQAIEAYLQQFL
jgi:pimeloyl-ACP methyl ester carboxylesterase